MEFVSDLASLINSTLRISTPLVFAAMAGIFAERSGVIFLKLSLLVKLDLIQIPL
jgi:ABC-type uncharacterized transport system permease subunit